MGSALNTNVNGSSGMCAEAANWLRGVKQGHEGGLDALQDAMNAQQGSWRGPAANEFHEAATRRKQAHAPFTERIGNAERALREFAERLDTVAEKMNTARSIAASGGVRVEGPFIIKPQRPPAPAAMPSGHMTPQQFEQALTNKQAAEREYNAALTEYNAQAAAYNKAKGHWSDARKLEGEAHQQLQEALRPAADSIPAPSATTLASAANTYIGTAAGHHATALTEANRFSTQASFYQRLADGTLAEGRPGYQALLQTSAANARANQAQALQRAKDYGKWIKGVPERARKVSTGYPGKTAAGLEKVGKHSSAELKIASKGLRRLPYLGSTLTMGTELWQAANGEQSWGESIARGGTILGSSALGSAGAGFAGGWAFGPAGAVIGGVGGAIAGGFAADAALDSGTG
ncbi:MAG: hypothetical protein GEU98_17740 [Pseudonocardiaceae bacterium]|nr:hypothetical protein [Pseudonocardiaceae bacterium]